MTTTIIGSPVSPYVRKILAILNLKGVDYAIDPLVPFLANDAFQSVSPLRRIPVLIDDQVTLMDSTVIAEYLDERYPAPALMPTSAADRARSRWLEEFADTRLCDLLIWGLFFQQAIRPTVFNEPADEARIAEVRDSELPVALDYLETQLPADGFIAGDAVSLGDIAVACPFKNALFVRWRPDPKRWPRVAGLVSRTLALPAFKALEPFETLCLKTPPAAHRDGLAGLGLTIADVNFLGDTPRRGVTSLG